MNDFFKFLIFIYYQIVYHDTLVIVVGFASAFSLMLSCFTMTSERERAATAQGLDDTLHTNMETPAGTPNRRPQLTSAGVASPGLNETLDTNHINVPADDTSICAKTTRLVLACTSLLFTPRQVLIIIRTLQTFTFAVLVFTVIADLMYIFFVTLVASDEVNAKVGGARDAIIRVYGLAMAIMALLIEFDVTSFLKNFSGLRGYVPRSFLLFFIATITSPNPLHEEYAFNRVDNNDNDNYDDYYDEDDQYDEQVSTEIPGSTVRFQMVISFLL